MKNRVWIILLLVAVSFSVLAQAQHHRIIAIGDFYYDGEVFLSEIGNFLAKSVRERVHFDFENSFMVMTVEETNELLVNNGLTYAWGSPAEKISEVFHKRGVTMAVMGQIAKIVQTADVDGSAEIKVMVNVSLYDVRGRRGVRTFDTEYKTRIDKKIRENTPWNEETGRKILGKLPFKIAAYIEDEMRRYQRRGFTF